MKHIIILGDGMADHRIKRIDNLTPLQHVRPKYMNLLAAEGKNGRLLTVPEGYNPGSEVANTSILGYDLDVVYEGRGPLEAASIGYEMEPDDLALRCNIITLMDGCIKNHHGGHLTTEQGGILIDALNEKLGNEKIKFIKGIQYRHLLIIKGGNKHIQCAPPHDHPDEKWAPLLVQAQQDAPHEQGRMTAEETATLINQLIHDSQEILAKHPFNKGRALPANSIWPWSGGYRPQMQPLNMTYPNIKKGAVISAVDLIRGIGKYAGLESITVEGMTGLANTNYEGKAQAAINALKNGYDFVFLHVEASDEAGHDGDLALKEKTIADLDRRIIEPIWNAVHDMEDEPVAIAVLPDHPTPVELRTHVGEPVPFVVWYPGITPDSVTQYDEYSCMDGEYHLLKFHEFMDVFMNL